MNLDRFILGELDPSKHRRFKEGHQTTPVYSAGKLTGIDCRCGWNIRVTALTLREMCEELAYLHRTKPELIIAESSDVETDARVRRLE